MTEIKTTIPDEVLEQLREAYAGEGSDAELVKQIVLDEAMRLQVNKKFQDLEHE